MPRTSAILVGGIITVRSGVSLDPFILSANELVTEKCTDSEYSDERLELIERWLAAHFYAIFHKRVASEQAGPVNQSFQYKIGLVLTSTMYGQHAMVLDTAGNLAALSKAIEEGRGPVSFGVAWLGTELDETEV